MGCFAGPEIPSGGLVLALDAGNTKGFDDDENLLLYSEQFDNASWTKSGVAVSTNATIAPDGTLTADLMTEDTGTNPHWTYYSTFPFTSNTYTLSIFAKQAVGSRYLRFSGFGLDASSESPIFDISSGIVYAPSTTTVFKSASIIPYPNGWYRCVCNIVYSGTGQRPFFRMTNSTTNFGNYTYTGDGTSGIYIWGAQLEYGSSVSPYYATTGTTKNRGTTLIDLTGNGNSGTLTNGPTYSSANGGSIVFDGTDDYISLTRNDFNTSLPNFTISALFYKTADGIILGNHYHNLTWESIWFSTTDFIVNAANDSTTNRQTLSYTTSSNSWMNLVAVNNSSQNYMKVFLNGTELATKTATVTPWNSSIIPTIGAQLFSGTNAPTGPISGKISQVSIYNRALSAAEIQQNFNATRGRYGL
jgi:hypothetical protein